MSKDKPEVDDVWCENKNNNIRYHITNVGEAIVSYSCKGGIGISPCSSFIERFVEECAYLGKSKANIDDLFKTENEE